MDSLKEALPFPLCPSPPSGSRGGFPPSEALEENHLIHSVEPFEVLIKAEGLFSSTCLDPQIQQEILPSNPTLIMMFTRFIHTPPGLSSSHVLSALLSWDKSV
ncbi:unnamed protein product [Gadus morhua 'NCC']